MKISAEPHMAVVAEAVSMVVVEKIEKHHVVVRDDEGRHFLLMVGDNLRFHLKVAA